MHWCILLKGGYINDLAGGKQSILQFRKHLRCVGLFSEKFVPSTLQALHPVLILAMIPLFDQVIYPFLEKQQVLIQPVLRILFGMMLGSLAFLLSGILQNAMDHVASTEAPPLSILWQIPQFVAISTADIMVSITFLEFAYSQAPDSMKSVIQAAWLFTIAAGKRHGCLKPRELDLCAYR
jgi:dipeptide/tripeptide permease